MKKQKSLLSRLYKRMVRVPFLRLRTLLAALVVKMRGRDMDKGGNFISRGVAASILLPSRGRVEMLRKTLKNIADTCGDPEKVEVLVRLDDDDAESLAAKESLAAECAPVPLKIFIGPRGGGYAEFHLFVNELSAAARGDFLILHNDDAYFDSPDWARVIDAKKERLAILNFDTHMDDLNPFPAVHRKIFEILGHFSLHSSCDMWMWYVGNNDLLYLRSMVPDVKMRHRSREDDWQQDKTGEEVQAFYPSVPKTFGRLKWARVYDAAILWLHIRRHGRSLQIQQEKTL